MQESGSRVNPVGYDATSVVAVMLESVERTLYVFPGDTLPTAEVTYVKGLVDGLNVAVFGIIASPGVMLALMLPKAKVLPPEDRVILCGFPSPKSFSTAISSGWK